VLFSQWVSAVQMQVEGCHPVVISICMSSSGRSPEFVEFVNLYTAPACAAHPSGSATVAQASALFRAVPLKCMTLGGCTNQPFWKQYLFNVPSWNFCVRPAFDSNSILTSVLFANSPLLTMKVFNSLRSGLLHLPWPVRPCR
jgi:hypothetical protein